MKNFFRSISRAFVPEAVWQEHPPDSIFETRRCPKCGEGSFKTYEDGGSHGYEVRLFCSSCKSEWGLHIVPKMCELVQQGDTPEWAR